MNKKTKIEEQKLIDSLIQAFNGFYKEVVNAKRSQTLSEKTKRLKWKI